MRNGRRAVREQGVRVVVVDPGPAAAATGPGAAGAGCLKPIAVGTVGTMGTDTAIGIEIDALFDGSELYIGGVMEQVEGMGAGSGAPTLTLPPVTLGRRDIERVRAAAQDVARTVGIRGLVHIRFALASDVLHVVGAEPGPSRTVPFVSTATGVPLARAAARIALGASIAELRDEEVLPCRGEGGTPAPQTPVAVLVTVPRAGAVMGIDAYFGAAYTKALAGAGITLPTKGRAFVSVARGDTRPTLLPLKALAALGFELLAPEDTAIVLRRHGIPATLVQNDVNSMATLNAMDGEFDLIIDTSPSIRPGSNGDVGGVLRVTTAAGLAATVRAIEALVRTEPAPAPVSRPV